MVKSTKSTDALYFVVQWELGMDLGISDMYDEAYVFTSLKEAKQYATQLLDDGYDPIRVAIFKGNLETKPKEVKIEWE